MSIAVAKIIRDGGKCPNKLQIHQEKEFYNAILKKTQHESLHRSANWGDRESYLTT